MDRLPLRRKRITGCHVGERSKLDPYYVMTCQYVKGRPMTLGEAKEICGFQQSFLPRPQFKIVGGRRVQKTEEEIVAYETERNAQQLRTFEGFQCGSFKPEPLCKCGHVADLLCDYPIGKGKTCDIPMCEKCRGLRVRDDVDLCEVHAIQHRTACGFRVIK